VGDFSFLVTAPGADGARLSGRIWTFAELMVRQRTTDQLQASNGGMRLIAQWTTRCSMIPPS
jgi:hypothetical protein